MHPAIKQITCESLQQLTPARINDDDFYVVEKQSGIVDRQVSGKGPRPQCAPGQFVVSGLTIKLSGLRLTRWIKAVTYQRGAA